MVTSTGSQTDTQPGTQPGTRAEAAEGAPAATPAATSHTTGRTTGQTAGATTAERRVAGPTTERLARLVVDVREAVSRGLAPDVTAYLVGEKLAPHLGAADLLTAAQYEGDAGCYRQHLLHAERDGSFSIVGLVWLPGQETPVHDHVSWCVTGVHQGEEHERRYRLVPAGADGEPARLVATEDVVNPQGAVCGFAPPGDIHRVWNGCQEKAVSLHIYGADIARIGSSVRRVYDLPADR